MEGEVRLQACQRCGKHHWPAVFRCPECGSWEHVWNQVVPRGKIYSWTRTWHRFGGLDAFEAPFVSLVVALEDVPSVRLLGVLDGEDADITIGDAVTGKVSAVSFMGRSIPALRWTID